MTENQKIRWLPLARLAEFTEGINAAAIEGVEMVVVKKEDQFSVFAGRCLHQEAPMSQGMLEDNHIVCSKHLWKYRLDSGALEGEPGISLQKFDTRLNDLSLEIREDQFLELKALYASYDEEDADEFYSP